jgi:hypothetical protein
MLMDSTLDVIMGVFEKVGVVREFMKSEMRLYTKTGHDVLFRSADDPEKLRGPNLGWFYMDEAALMPEIVMDIMMGRLRLDPGRAWLTTTPRGMNWVHRLFVEEKRPDYALVQCSTRSNIFLPKHFVQSLASKYKGSWKDQELEGQFVDWVKSPAYDAFRRPLHVKAGLMSEYRERLPLKLACDFNARCMVWSVIQVNGRTPRILMEISQIGRTSIPQMVKQFRLAFPNHVGGLQIFGDASGLNLAAQTGTSSYDVMLEAFRGYTSTIDLVVPKANPPVRSRVNSVNGLLTGVGEWEPLQIDESCEMVIRDFSHVEWDESGTSLMKITATDDERSTLTHATDAIGYWSSIDSPVASLYIPKGEDPERIDSDERRRWMNQLHEREVHEGLYGLDL